MQMTSLVRWSEVRKLGLFNCVQGLFSRFTPSSGALTFTPKAGMLVEIQQGFKCLKIGRRQAFADYQDSI